jgi:hypothetical protein
MVKRTFVCAIRRRLSTFTAAMALYMPLACVDDIHWALLALLGGFSRSTQHAKKKSCASSAVAVSQREPTTGVLSRRFADSPHARSLQRSELFHRIAPRLFNGNFHQRADERVFMAWASSIPSG